MPLITNTADLDPVLYAYATLSAGVRCADDEILILQRFVVPMIKFSLHSRTSMRLPRPHCRQAK